MSTMMPKKVPFEELPDDWKCPLCGAAKSDFKPETNGDEKKVVTAIEPMGRRFRETFSRTTGSTLFNLARGCEKQYKQEETDLFKQLADYFTAVVPAVNDASVEKLAKELQTDANNYAAVRATADANADRVLQEYVYGVKRLQECFHH